jgi:hypothetical protein
MKSKKKSPKKVSARVQVERDRVEDYVKETKWDRTPCWTGAEPSGKDTKMAFEGKSCPRCGHVLIVGHGGPDMASSPAARVVAKEQFASGKNLKALWFVFCLDCGIELGRGPSAGAPHIDVVRRLA